MFDAIHERSLCPLLVAAGLLLLLALPSFARIPFPPSPRLSLACSLPADSESHASFVPVQTSLCLLACLRFNILSLPDPSTLLRFAFRSGSGRQLCYSKLELESFSVWRSSRLDSKLAAASTIASSQEPNERAVGGRESCDLGLAIRLGTRTRTFD